MGNDADSYRRYLEGDDNGLIEIMRDNNEGITLFINSIVGNICNAEEIMQETFIDLAVKKPRYSSRSSFKTWLYSIARHKALDFIRSKPHGYVSEDECLSLSDETDIEKSYIKDEQRIELHRAVKKLPPDYHQVIELIYFENFDNEQAAKIMKKSRRQIRNFIYRAKQALKKELDKEGFVYEEL